ncbi:hypothetical protein MNBD_GAMMA26-390 [hydrothermal vent metagenome]|uniref:Core-binding (CB) domain-containing protein n=1 Tax=hydrothermal vent metagenome TaxID=652676 RepID=A0A3B1ANP5_9ZZZZ
MQGGFNSHLASFPHSFKSSTKISADQFWDKFIASLLKQGIKEVEARWCVLRAEQYIRAFPDKRLADNTVDDVTGYLESVGRQGQLADWQFIQTVSAIQNLLRTAKAPVQTKIDWGYWRDSARTLSSNHPTVAREAFQHDDEQVSGARFKKKRNKASFLDSIRKDHSKLLEQLATEIRRRKYSIRTEQAYEVWVCRFIGFCDNRDPVGLSAKQVVAFLEDLAVRGNVAASTQNQALNALVFLYKQVLHSPLDELEGFTRAKRLPVVLERGEVGRLLERLDGL